MTLKEKLLALNEQFHGDVERICSGEMDVMDNLKLWDELYFLYERDMPYGTAKARTGDPDEFVSMRLDKDLHPEDFYRD